MIHDSGIGLGTEGSVMDATWSMSMSSGASMSQDADHWAR